MMLEIRTMVAWGQGTDWEGARKNILWDGNVLYFARDVVKLCILLYVNNIF